MAENIPAKIIDVRFLDEAVDAIERMCQITGRTREELESDIHRTFMWILLEQTLQHRIISEGDPSGPFELECLILNQDAARTYFEEMGWLPRTH